MRASDQATEHLQIIRSLMERTTIYRTISAPTALFGGCLSVILALLLTFRLGHTDTTIMSSVTWLYCWLGAMVTTVIFNTVLIMRKCRHESQPLFSPGLRHAIRSTFPAMISGGVIGVTFLLNDPSKVVATAALWLTFYGLALLSTSSFSPRSMRIMGVLFLIAGLVGFITFHCPSCTKTICPCDITTVHYTAANLMMGIGFGSIHIVYGLCLVASDRKAIRAQ